MPLLAKHGGLYVPQSLLEDQKPSEAFVKRLHAVFGKEMHVEWNPRRSRWVIEQCIEHDRTAPSMTSGHTHLCRRVYVWLVRGDDDDYMPLGDRVIEKLHEMETERRYGTGEYGLQNFLRESKNFDQAQAEKQKQNAREVTQYSRRHNRTTFNKFMDLFRRHDMRPNK